MAGLTAAKSEGVKRKAIRARQTTLRSQRPRLEDYLGEQGRAERMVSGAFKWAKASVPVIFLLAVMGSMVRTLMTIWGVYEASGTETGLILVAAVGLSLATEGAIFPIEMALEQRRMARRAAKEPRRVLSLRELLRMLGVRLGLAEPRRWDEMQGDGLLAMVVWIALIVALTTNLYQSLHPLLANITLGVAEGTLIIPGLVAGEVITLQELLGNLGNLPADLQMIFIVDVILAVFPPLMAKVAGMLTAQFAAEVGVLEQDGLRAHQDDLRQWQVEYVNPLDFAAGQEALDVEMAALEDRLAQGSVSVPPMARVEADNGRGVGIGG